ncbi:TolC family protein [Mucilaginibacter ginkgonis]|uniref:TolC family protein n=1 Tax=Mucilaginibacter ginkgonis TaxID=2682091 RepID=A0A6I4I1R7_9SPHI|nr:TolC family protein [Mucilaginibacter ginkgonis]QQL50879.1 TolC family protein [Mucilaginibacter ginkgonis]
MRKYLITLKITAVLLVCFTLSAKAQTGLIQEISEVYLTKLVETARLHYPRVKTYNSRIKIAEGNVAKAKLSYFDEFTLSYIYSPHAGQGTTGVAATNPVSTTTGATTTIASNYNYFNSIQVGFFFNPTNFLIKPHNVRQSKEELNIAYNDQAEYLITLRTDIKKLYYVFKTREAELKVQIQNASLDDQTLTLEKRRFEKGEETFELYSKAVAGASANTLARIAAESGYLAAKADLEALLGEKIENIR